MKVPIGANLRKYRSEGRLTLGQLSELSGVKIGTLSAIEHGRILNPSFESLKQISGALQIASEALWEDPEESPRSYKGDLKGAVQFEFKKEGLTLISYTPLVKELFIGKGFLKPRRAFDLKRFPRLNSLFIEIVVGKLELKGETSRSLLAEGDNLFLRPPGRRTVSNPFQMKETSFLLVTAPSLISADLESRTPSA